MELEVFYTDTNTGDSKSTVIFLDEEAHAFTLAVQRKISSSDYGDSMFSVADIKIKNIQFKD